MVKETTTDKGFDSMPEKIERTGEKTFNVMHDDGSIFEMKADKAEIVANLDKKPPPIRKNSFSGIGDGDMEEKEGWVRTAGNKLRKVFFK